MFLDITTVQWRLLYFCLNKRACYYNRFPLKETILLKISQAFDEDIVEFHHRTKSSHINGLPWLSLLGKYGFMPSAPNQNTSVTSKCTLGFSKFLHWLFIHDHILIFFLFVCDSHKQQRFFSIYMWDLLSM